MSPDGNANPYDHSENFEHAHRPDPALDLSIATASREIKEITAEVARMAWIDVARPRAILFITDPEEADTIRPENLRQDFGLTSAEAGFAREILKADGLQATADRLGISLTTARTHLAHVFDKTGTRRQAELVRLILQSLPAASEN